MFTFVGACADGRVMFFSPARASTGVTHTVKRDVNVNEEVRVSLAASRGDDPVRVGSSVAVVTIPICTNEMTPVTLRQLQELGNGGTPTVLITMCNGHSCRSTLIRLESRAVRLKFAPLTTNTFVNRRDCDHPGVPVTRNHPSIASLRVTRRFKGSYLAGLRGSRALSSFCLGKGVPCHFINPSAPTTPIYARRYFTYNRYVRMYPARTVTLDSRKGVRARVAGYVGYYTYMGRYPGNTQIFSAPCAPVLRRGYTTHHRPRLFVW